MYCVVYVFCIKSNKYIRLYLYQKIIEGPPLQHTEGAEAVIDWEAERQILL